MCAKYIVPFFKLLKSVEAKRPRTVIQHILEHGQVTTEELKEVYGYNHPPRETQRVAAQQAVHRALGIDENPGDA